MNALAIETSGEALGLAVATNDGKLVATIRRAGLGHAEWLAPSLKAILDQAGIRPA